MTSQGNVMYLFVFVFLIFKSEQSCNIVYFSEETLKNYTNESVTLVHAADPKDVVECTLEKECLKKGNRLTLQTQFMLRCFDREDIMKCRNTAKCQNLESYTNVSFYHFLCLTAKALNISDDLGHTGCNYGAVCPLYRNLSRATTLPERTTAAPTSLQLTPQRTTTTGAADMQSRVANATCSKDTCGSENYLKVLLVLSVFFNLVFVLGFSLYMLRQRRLNQLEFQSSVPNGLILTPPENQPLTEAKPPECQSVLTHVAEQNGHEDL